MIAWPFRHKAWHPPWHRTFLVCLLWRDVVDTDSRLLRGRPRVRETMEVGTCAGHGCKAPRMCDSRKLSAAPRVEERNASRGDVLRVPRHEREVLIECRGRK